jgi:hypothetical protein
MRYPTCDADVEDASPSGAEVAVHVRDGELRAIPPAAEVRLIGSSLVGRWSDIGDMLPAWLRSAHVLRVHRTHVPWIWSRPHA